MNSSVNDTPANLGQGVVYEVTEAYGVDDLLVLVDKGTLTLEDCSRWAIGLSNLNFSGLSVEDFGALKGDLNALLDAQYARLGVSSNENFWNDTDKMLVENDPFSVFFSSLTDSLSGVINQGLSGAPVSGGLKASLKSQIILAVTVSLSEILAFTKETQGSDSVLYQDANKAFTFSNAILEDFKEMAQTALRYAS